MRRAREAGSGVAMMIAGETDTVYEPTPLAVTPYAVKTPVFMMGVAEPEGQVKSCAPTRPKVPMPAVLPPSKLLKAMVIVVQVPLTSTGKLENQNASEFPPLGVACMPRVKSATNAPLDPGPEIW
jgi:hypothetical protein